MSFSDQARLREALNVLCNISIETLQSHWAEILLTLKNLEALVNHHPLISQVEPLQSTEFRNLKTAYPVYHSPSPPTSKTIDRPLVSTSSTYHGSFPAPVPPHAVGAYQSSSSRSITRLLQALDQEKCQIKDFLLRHNFEAAGNELALVIEDPRVADLQLHSRRPSLEARFRRGLSQRSLAIEFTEWENCTYGWSRVGALSEKMPISRREGHIMEYLNRNTHRFQNQEAAREGIQHGIRMLVCETLLGTITISAILCFKKSQLHDVKFEELGSLTTMMDQKEWIKELVVHRSGDWFDDCQKKYNAWWNKMLQRLVLPMSLDTQAKVTTSSSTQDKGSDNPASSPITSQQNSTCYYDLATMMPAHFLSVPQEGSRHQYDLATLASAHPLPVTRDDSRCQYDFAALASANPIHILQEASRFEYDLATLAPVNPLYDIQDGLRDQYDLATLPQVNCPPLLYESVPFGSNTVPPFTVLPQPLSAHV